MAMLSRSSHNSTRAVGSTHAVKVISNTWARDSHDLFDFETQQLHSKTFSVQGSMTCVRSGSDVDVAQDGAAIPSGTDSLIRVVERGGSFWVDRANSASVRKLWMVVREVAPTGHRLTEGDVIKLGRFKFRVRQLVTGEETDTVRPDLGLDETCMQCRVETSEDLENKPCRICLMEGPGEGDPLITPCKCKGSIQYVHLKCLRYWTKSRLNLCEDPLGSYFYKPTTCELCHAPFPTYMDSNEGPRAPLMELPTTQPPYIVLESVVRDTRQHTRGLHVISLAEKALKLGRGHESDVRIADVSISRCHANIRFERGRFLLQDNNSKFGTLVAMKRPRQIEASRPLALQIGRTVLSLTLTPCPSGSIDSAPPPPPPAAAVPAPSASMLTTMAPAPAFAEDDRWTTNLPLSFLARRDTAAGSGAEAAGNLAEQRFMELGAEHADDDGAYVRRHMSF